MAVVERERNLDRGTWRRPRGGFVQAVVSIDGKMVADGKPGPMTNRLREIYVEFAKATAV